MIISENHDYQLSEVPVLKIELSKNFKQVSKNSISIKLANEIIFGKYKVLNAIIILVKPSFQFQ